MEAVLSVEESPRLSADASYSDLEDTKPDSPSGQRLRALESDAEACEVLARDALRSLGGQPRTVLVEHLRSELSTCASEFKSWQLCQPTPEVRARVVDKFARLSAQARSVVTGARS